MLEYYCVCIPQMIISMFLLDKLLDGLNISAPILAACVRVVVDTLLFFISYFIQKKWVFKETGK